MEVAEVRSVFLVEVCSEAAVEVPPEVVAVVCA